MSAPKSAEGNSSIPKTQTIFFMAFLNLIFDAQKPSLIQGPLESQISQNLQLPRRDQGPARRVFRVLPVFRRKQKDNPVVFEVHRRRFLRPVKLPEDLDGFWVDTEDPEVRRDFLAGPQVPDHIRAGNLRLR